MCYDDFVMAAEQISGMSRLTWDEDFTFLRSAEQIPEPE